MLQNQISDVAYNQESIKPGITLPNLIVISLRNSGVKVCSINFEPPDDDLCPACHDHPLFGGAWII